MCLSHCSIRRRTLSHRRQRARAILGHFLCKCSMRDFFSLPQRHATRRESLHTLYGTDKRRKYNITCRTCGINYLFPTFFFFFFFHFEASRIFSIASGLVRFASKAGEIKKKKVEERRYIGIHIATWAKRAERGIKVRVVALVIYGGGALFSLLYVRLYNGRLDPTLSVTAISSAESAEYNKRAAKNLGDLINYARKTKFFKKVFNL